MLNPREVAIKTVENVLFKKEFATESFEKLAKSLNEHDRRLAWEIIMGIFRNLYYLDYKIKKHAKSGKIDKKIINILRTGAYQLLFLDRIPPYAAVSESVKIAKKVANKTKANFVNAILRCICGDKDTNEINAKNDIEYLSLNYSYPIWIIKKLISEYGREKAEEILRNSNTRPELFLRVNTRLISPDKLVEILRRNNIDAQYVSEFPEYISIGTDPPKIDEIVGYKEGYFFVQDPSFGIPVYLLQPSSGETILDIGASPGGKSTHMATLNNAFVISLDLPNKMKKLDENKKRLRLKNINLVAANGLNPPFKPSTFKKILVDAPCSNLGIVRRHPEIRYIKSPQNIIELSGLQKRLGKIAFELLQPKGILVYSTCTLFKEENEDVIDYLLSLGMKISYPHEFPIKEFITERGFIKTFPGRFDGSFSARLIKL